MSLKTSTCVLFDKKKKFHSFGFEAEDNYVNFAEEDESHKDYYFFRRFKMKLFDKMVSKYVMYHQTKSYWLIIHVYYHFQKLKHSLTKLFMNARCNDNSNITSNTYNITKI